MLAIYVYIVTVKLRLKAYKATCIIVSLDTYIVDIITFDNYSLLFVDYVKSKDNITDVLTKMLNRELVEKSSRRMRLTPMKKKVVARET